MTIEELARQMTFAYPLFELLEKAKIKFFHNEKIEPILIYQMGKVGSSTIYQTLQKSGVPNSIYHVHYLSKSRIDKAIKTYKNLQSSLIPMHLRRSKLLVNKFDLQKDKIKIITLTREPVGRMISEFFQNIAYFSPEVMSGRNTIDYEASLTKVKTRINNYDINDEEAATWFDKEFYNALGLDVYSTIFPKEKGYQIIKKDNIECLIIQMEKLNDVAPKALNEFLKTDTIVELKQTNIGSEKKFSEIQKKIKNTLQFNKESLRYIYSSKYMKHFYTDDEILKFIKKWEN